MERIDKERKDLIMEKIRKAGDSDNYETSWEGGVPVSKEKVKIKQGKFSKAAGRRFELRVRKDLEEKGRVVDKWSNNVDLEEDKLIPVKRKFIRRPLGQAYLMGVSTIGTGFPDFISIKKVGELYSVIGVEVKMNGQLSKVEKQKCAWYLQNGIFSEIWIASAEKDGRKIKVVYEDFKEKYGDKYNKT
jgi:hypothetical protein